MQCVTWHDTDSLYKRKLIFILMYDAFIHILNWFYTIAEEAADWAKEMVRQIKPFCHDRKNTFNSIAVNNVPSAHSAM